MFRTPTSEEIKMTEHRVIEITPLSRRCLEQLAAHLTCRPPFTAPTERAMLKHALEYGLAQLVREARRQVGWEVEPPPATLEKLGQQTETKRGKTP